MYRSIPTIAISNNKTYIVLFGGNTGTNNL